MLIGDKIRLLRKNKNVTQVQLAEALSVSSQSVSKWENHLSVPDISVGQFQPPRKLSLFYRHLGLELM